MKLDWVITRYAESDLWAIWDFIAQDNMRAAESLVLSVRELCEQLTLHPGLGEQFKSARRIYRRISLGNYVIYFRQTPATIEILRILHGSRDVENLL
jgi:toxin ParE1/3/4